eukprot:gene23412-6768_t
MRAVHAALPPSCDPPHPSAWCAGYGRVGEVELRHVRGDVT